MQNKTCHSCNSEVNFFAQFCPGCGTKMHNYDISCIDGVNQYRNKIFSKTTKQSYISNLMSIEIEQGVINNPEDIPGLAGAGNILLIPKAIGNCFVLRDIEQHKEIGIINLQGEIRFAHTPVFDGLYFNIICESKLHRVRVNRQGEMLTSIRELNLDISSKKIKSPLLLQESEKRYLLYIIENTLFVIDISAVNQEKIISKTDLPRNNYSPLLYKDPNLFCTTKDGKLYKILFNKDKAQLENYSLVHEYNLKYMTYPIILREKILYALGCGINENVILCGLNLETNKKIFKDTEIECNDQVSLNHFPLHDGHRLIIKNPFDEQKFSFATHISISRPIIFTDQIELNNENFFILENMIYSLSVTDQKIYRYNGGENKVSSSIPLTQAIGQHMNPLHEMVYINGIIAMLTDERVYLYQV